MATTATAGDRVDKDSSALRRLARRISLADSLLFLCVTIWAFNVPLLKMVLGYLHPLETSIIRFGFAGIAMFVLVGFTERSFGIQMRHLPLIIACALMGITLNQVFFVYALSNTSSSEVSLLMGTTPSFAVLVAWLAGQEKVGKNYWQSLPISAAGIALIILTAPHAQLSGGWLGDLLAIATAGSWAAYTVLIRSLMHHYSISRLSAWITSIGTLFLLPFGIPQFDFGAMGTIPANVWFAIAYATLGAVVLTNVLWYFGVKQLGGPRTAFYSYLQPFLGVLAACLILGEAIVGWQVLGGVLVILGMIIYRRRQTVKPAAVTEAEN